MNSNACACARIQVLEDAFYKLGLIIATWPTRFLVVSLLFTAFAGSGLLFWNEEVENVELFLDPSMDLYWRSHWVEDNFKEQLRYESVIIEADNVLRPDVLSAIADLHKSIQNLNVTGIMLSDVCARYDTWFESSGGISLNDTDGLIDADDLKRIPTGCLFQSLMKLWMVNDTMIKSLQHENSSDINKRVYHALTSSVPANILDDITPLIADVQWDQNKTHLYGAKATIINWMLNKFHNDSPLWELGFIQETLFSNRTLPPGMQIYAVSTRSYDDFLRQVVENNTTLLFAGFSLIICYVVLMMSRFDAVEQRVYLSLLGVSVIGQSILASYGLCFYMGFFWGPLHPVLPFLLLGIGVNNIFIIMQCLENINENKKMLSVPEKIATVLQNSGISVTVTILTDVVAFAVGTTTKMPFLRSFCVFAAVGVLCVYVFILIFFTSCLSIDEKRISERREGCLFRKYDEAAASGCRKRNIQKEIFSHFLAPTLLKFPVKIGVLLVTVVLLGINIWGTLHVEQRFDPMWYLSQESYPIKYYEKLTEYFPFYGKRGGIYMSGVDYYSDDEVMNTLTSELEQNPYINQESLKLWLKEFKKFLEGHKYDVESEDEYKSYLMEFLLFNNTGQAFMKDLRFKGFPKEGYNITAAQFPFQYVMLNNTEEQIRAMNSIDDIIASLNISNGTIMFSYSPDFVGWMANKIIGEELFRNLAIIFGAVFFVTLLLIQNISTVLLVNCCVVFTVVDLVGSMYWMDLTIEISTSLLILLCAGLAVDYAAHFGKEFVGAKGKRNERTMTCIINIGPAVLNGGFSTFLAFSLLGSSDSYLFTTFFKLFTGVVVFGLFHGLFFLPIILSFVGPSDLIESSEGSLEPRQINGFVQLQKTDDIMAATTYVPDNTANNTANNN